MNTVVVLFCIFLRKLYLKSQGHLYPPHAVVNRWFILILVLSHLVLLRIVRVAVKVRTDKIVSVFVICVIVCVLKSWLMITKVGHQLWLSFNYTWILNVATNIAPLLSPTVNLSLKYKYRTIIGVKYITYYTEWPLYNTKHTKHSSDTYTRILSFTVLNKVNTFYNSRHYTDIRLGSFSEPSIIWVLLRNLDCIICELYSVWNSLRFMAI